MTTPTKAELRSRIIVLEQSLEAQLALNRDLVQELAEAYRRVAELAGGGQRRDLAREEG